MYMTILFYFIGLKHWDSGDNAWSEHRRFSPSCNFVLESTETDRLLTSDADEVCFL